MARRIFAVLTLLLMLTVLELNKNTLWGWALALLLAVGYVLLTELALKDKGFLPKAGVWALWVASFVGVLFLTWPPLRQVPAVDYKNPARTEIVTVAQGQVTGVRNESGDVEIFTGIPYAAPPVGDLRWREPQDPAPWTGVLEADTFAPMGMQPCDSPIYGSLKQIIGFHDYKIRLDDNYRGAVSEDCLYVNVWRPANRDAAPLPVLVYIHGGSLQTGQPWYADYSGEGLAKQGVIVVNLGYRLGVFGFLADAELQAESPNGTTGNYGLLDQIKALEWVRDNIAAFGGDPGNVTLAGESAGAASVSALCTSPLAKGLFQRVILESSTVASKEPPHSFRLLDEALAAGKDLKARHNCASVAELRALPAEDLVNDAYTEHHITVDGYALTKTPYEAYRAGEYNETAILHGCNAEESAAFLILNNAKLKDYETRVRGFFGAQADRLLAAYPAATDAEAKAQWADVYGNVFFGYPHYCLNRLANENGIPVWEYYFTKTNGRLGCWHSGEEVYFYGNIPADSRLYDEADRTLGRQMSAYFVNFIKTGDPNGTDAAGNLLPQWAQNTSNTDLLELGEAVRMISETHLPLYEILDDMQQFQP